MTIRSDIVTNTWKIRISLPNALVLESDKYTDPLI